jgi:hypothetical protein
VVVCFVLIAVRVASGDIVAPLLAGSLLLGALVIYLAMRRLR